MTPPTCWRFIDLSNDTIFRDARSGPPTLLFRWRPRSTVGVDVYIFRTLDRHSPLRFHCCCFSIVGHSPPALRRDVTNRCDIEHTSLAFSSFGLLYLLAGGWPYGIAHPVRLNVLRADSLSLPTAGAALSGRLPTRCCSIGVFIWAVRSHLQTFSPCWGVFYRSTVWSPPYTCYLVFRFWACAGCCCTVRAATAHWAGATSFFYAPATPNLVTVVLHLYRDFWVTTHFPHLCFCLHTTPFATPCLLLAFLTVSRTCLLVPVPSFRLLLFVCLVGEHSVGFSDVLCSFAHVLTLTRTPCPTLQFHFYLRNASTVHHASLHSSRWHFGCRCTFPAI